jgi:hypothetical protein
MNAATEAAGRSSDLTKTTTEGDAERKVLVFDADNDESRRKVKRPDEDDDKAGGRSNDLTMTMELKGGLAT